MTAEEFRDMLAAKIASMSGVASVGTIEDEEITLGIEMQDGTMFFLSVQEA